MHILNCGRKPAHLKVNACRHRENGAKCTLVLHMFLRVCVCERALVQYCVGNNVWHYGGCYPGTCILSLLFWLSDTLILFPSQALSSYSVLASLLNNQTYGTRTIRSHLCLSNSHYSFLSSHWLLVFLWNDNFFSFSILLILLIFSSRGDWTTITIVSFYCLGSTLIIVAIWLLYYEAGCICMTGTFLMFTCSILINYS